MTEYVTLKLSDIIPYERNPRKNDVAVDDVAESIRQCGYKARIIVDENNVIIAGHTRYKALQKLGWTEVEVQRETEMTETQKRKYRLLDNKVGEKAGWDFELLDWELEDLDFEGYDFGFDLGAGKPAEKAFLMEAANRHVVFDYRKIAEYYARASAEMQRLMERSALVIIDINNAIADGYAELSKRIEEMRGGSSA